MRANEPMEEGAAAMLDETLRPLRAAVAARFSGLIAALSERASALLSAGRRRGRAGSTVAGSGWRATVADRRST